jgi:hypothetical protein
MAQAMHGKSNWMPFLHRKSFKFNFREDLKKNPLIIKNRAMWKE